MSETSDEKINRIAKQVDILFKKYNEDLTIKAYEEKKKQQLMWWLKLPGAIVASLVTIGVILTWLLEGI